MATIKFLLQSKSPSATIYVRISAGRSTVIKRKTPLIVDPKDWNPKKQTLKEVSRLALTEEVAKRRNELIKKLADFNAHLVGALNKAGSSGAPLNGYWLENQINFFFHKTTEVDNSIIVNHYQHIIDNAKTRKVQGRNKLGLSESRVKGLITSKNILQAYQAYKRAEYTFSDIDAAFAQSFTNWLITKKSYSVNYAGKQLDNLKAICQDAERMGIATNPNFKHIQGFTESDDERHIVTLSFDELERIRTAEIKSSALDNARRWILLGCEIGQRGNDLLNISAKNLRYRNGRTYLDIVQQKTGKEVTIPILPTVADIVENMPRKVTMQKLNDYIKEVCKIAGIDEVVDGKKMDAKTGRKVLAKYPKYELVTTHCFRRSFATNYYKVIPTPVIMAITSHKKEQTFLQYVNKQNDKDSNADLFMQFYDKLSAPKEPQLKVIKSGTND
jgi:integrase